MSWYWRWLLTCIAAIAATGAIGLGLAILLADDTGVGEFCAGTGTITATSGSSPEEALAVYVVEAGGDPADWEPGGQFGPHAFRPARPGARPQAAELQAAEIDSGVWQITGTCEEVGPAVLRHAP